MTQPTQPVPAGRPEPVRVFDETEERRTTSPASAVSAFFAFVLFLGGLALFPVAFEVAEAARAWVFFGAIAAVTLAFAIPTTILPALEDR